MKWFKHYSNCKDSNSLTLLMAKEGMIGYGRYWRLLELMSQKYDGIDDFVFVFVQRDLKAHLGFHRDQDLIKFLSSLNQVGFMSYRAVDQVIEIQSAILLKLQAKDFKKPRSICGQTAPKNKDLRLKSKDVDEPQTKNETRKAPVATKPSFRHPATMQEFLDVFPEEVFAHWFSLYQNNQDWVARELEKCYGYFYVNKSGKPSASVKGWVQRASSWLERGWMKNTGQVKKQDSGLRKTL